MYLLEPKEIQENIRGLSSTMDAIEACNKAQLRKDVENFLLPNASYVDYIDGQFCRHFKFWMPEDAWKQLRKEVEDGD